MVFPLQVRLSPSSFGDKNIFFLVGVTCIFLLVSGQKQHLYFFLLVHFQHRMAIPLPKYQLNRSSVETLTLKVVLASANPNSESSVEKGKALIRAADVFVLAYEHFHVTVPLQAKIEIITGYAAFTGDPRPTVEVGGEKYTAPHILIATGGVPSHPQESQIPGESPRGKCL